MISLDWEEGIFRGLYKLWHSNRSEPAFPGAVCFDEIADRVQTVAQLMAGCALMVRKAEGVGGIRGRVLLLPESMGVAPSPGGNLTLYLLRGIINATMIELWGDSPPDTLGLPGRVRYLFAVRRAHGHLCQHFPQFPYLYTRALGWELASRPPLEEFKGTAAALESLRRDIAHGKDLDEERVRGRFVGDRDPGELPPGFLLWGETLTASDMHTATQASSEEFSSAPASDGAELKSPPRDHVSLTCLERVDEVPPLPIHTFEKTETLDTFKGGMRQVDGEDELEEHLEALRDLDLREVIRGGPESFGFYKADVDLSGAIPDIHHVLPCEQGIPYPEWFFKTRCYRPDWVTVYPTAVAGYQPTLARSIIAAQRGRILKLRDRLLAHRSRYDHCTRQVQGDELDLEAVVNAYGDRRAGLDPGEKLYISQRKCKREPAVTLLFDVSLSSGSWVDGRRILDITRETVLILGEVADSLGDRFRILAFASNTRNHCRVWDVKPWSANWSRSLGRVCAVEPQGYTRIGPALRHALAGFEGIDTRSKGLIVITDGKPTDFDRYEGQYGREDIRMAIREGRDQGIFTHALALDPRARRTLPAMFGTAGWQVLRRPADLTEAVVAVYGSMHGN